MRDISAYHLIFPSSQVGESSQFRDINVTLSDMIENRIFAERDLLLSSKSQEKKEPIPVKHFQFLKWPNYGIPDSPEELAEFVYFVFRHLESNPKVVIHCSGGLGRSGTFMAIYASLKRVSDFLKFGAGSVGDQNADDLTLEPMIATMRTQRHPWMVEGNHQLELAYKTLLILLKRLLEKHK